MIGIDMQMPETCGNCRFMVDGWCYCTDDSGVSMDEYMFGRRADWCPLVDLSNMEDDLK